MEVTFDDMEVYLLFYSLHFILGVNLSFNWLVDRKIDINGYIKIDFIDIRSVSMSIKSKQVDIDL